MSIVLKLFGGIAILLLVCTLICGFWVKANPGEGLEFHGMFSTVSVIFALITIILFLLKMKS